MFRSLACIAALSLAPPSPASALTQQGLSSPRDLAGNVLWLDASDPDGDLSSGGGFMNGNRWVDKSSVGNADAIQGSVANRPAVVPDGLAGKSVVRFDGNDYMDLAQASFGMLRSVGGATLFGVVKTTATSPQRVLMISANYSMRTRAGLNLFDGFGTSIGGMGDYGAAGRRLDTDPFQRIEAGAVELGSFEQYAALFEYSQGRLSLSIDGATLTSVGNFQTPGLTSNSSSANIRVGADAKLTGLMGVFSGDIAELIVYDRALDPAERLLVEDYLDARWFQTLDAAPSSLSITTGGTQTLEIDAGSAHSGELYIVLGSAAGTSPGVSLGGISIPLNPDAYTSYTIASGSGPFLPGTIGLLDSQGNSGAGILVPGGVLNPSLAGLSLNHAYLCFSLSGVPTLASNAVDLLLVP